jgi:hypothetical protein
MKVDLKTAGKIAIVSDAEKFINFEVMPCSSQALKAPGLDDSGR